MNGPTRRLRLGVFLALALMVGVQIADVATGSPNGGPGVPSRAGVALAGMAGASSFQVLGFGGSVPAVAFERTLVCAPCSVTVAVTASSLLVAGGGAVGVLPPGKVYTIAGYFGELSTTGLADGSYALAFTGAAEAIREQPPGWA